jgi:hypothetical protein
MRNLLIFLLAFALPLHSSAQTVKRIKKGRRYKSESLFTLHPNDFEAEWEIGREATDTQLTTFIYPNLVLHYALSDRCEVNTEMSLVTVKHNSYSEKYNTTGIEPVLIGANYQILPDKDKRPSIIVAAQLAIPFLSTKAFSINYLAPFLQINIQEALFKKWIFGLNGGLLWDGYSSAPSFTYDGNVSYTPKKKWMITVECFGFTNKDMLQNNLDASLAYQISSLMQFGITGGLGISAYAPKNYVAVNGTWGFNAKRHAQAH